MLEERLVVFDQSKKSVCAQSLHQSLHRAEPQCLEEIMIRFAAAIVLQQFVPLALGKVDIGIVEERSEIVLGESRSHSLEINQISLTIAHDDVLRLKITMD